MSKTYLKEVLDYYHNLHEAFRKEEFDYGTTFNVICDLKDKGHYIFDVQHETLIDDLIKSLDRLKEKYFNDGLNYIAHHNLDPKIYAHSGFININKPFSKIILHVCGDLKEHPAIKIKQ